jgi:hypothetical protein
MVIYQLGSTWMRLSHLRSYVISLSNFCMNHHRKLLFIGNYRLLTIYSIWELQYLYYYYFRMHFEHFVIC